MILICNKIKELFYKRVNCLQNVFHPREKGIILERKGKFWSNIVINVTSLIRDGIGEAHLQQR